MEFLCFALAIVGMAKVAYVALAAIAVLLLGAMTCIALFGSKSPAQSTTISTSVASTTIAPSTTSIRSTSSVVTTSITEVGPTTTIQQFGATPWIPENQNPWPMFNGGYNHDGYANVSGPQSASLKWKYFAGGGRPGSPSGAPPGSIAVSSSGMVYVAGSGSIIALRPDATVAWSKSYQSVQGPALSANGSVVYMADGNSVVALNSTTGAQMWQYQMGDSTLFGPTVGPDGTIYQGSWDRYFYALNPGGTLKWKYLTEGAVSYPASIGTDGTIYLGGGDPHSGPDPNAYAFYPNGTLKWKYDTKQLRVGTPAVAADDFLYISAGQVFYGMNPDGTVAWSISSLPPNPPDSSVSGIVTAGIAPDGTIYVGSPSGVVSAINPNTHEVIWSYRTGASASQPGFYGLPTWPVVDKRGDVYLGAEDGKMYAFSEGGTLLWSYQTGGSITEAAPALDANGDLYFSSQDGYVYAIS